MAEVEPVEPWLRGTLTEVDAVRRQVLHALELTGEDVTRWCAGLTDEEMEARPFGLASVGFHLRHMARSLDRLLTYAEGRPPEERQMAQLRSEMEPVGSAATVMAEFRTGLAGVEERILQIAPENFGEARCVGRALLPTTVGGLLVHCAEHTQRHSGQTIVTAKVLVGMR